MRISDWSSDVGSSDLKRQFTWFRHPQIAHHAGFLMFDDVAVEHPVARPAANEGNLHPLVRPHQHGVAPMRAYILFGRGNHPEGMAVQMHRMGMRRAVEDFGDVAAYPSEDRKSTRLNSSH